MKGTINWQVKAMSQLLLKVVSVCTTQSTSSKKSSSSKREERNHRSGRSLSINMYYQKSQKLSFIASWMFGYYIRFFPSIFRSCAERLRFATRPLEKPRELANNSSSSIRVSKSSGMSGSSAVNFLWFQSTATTKYYGRNILHNTVC